MHETAWITANLFFTYISHIFPTDSAGKILNILDIGSLDQNGNLREAIEHSPFHQYHFYEYIGVDNSPGPNVDVALGDSWNFNENEFDFIIYPAY